MVSLSLIFDDGRIGVPRHVSPGNAVSFGRLAPDAGSIVGLAVSHDDGPQVAYLDLPGLPLIPNGGDVTVTVPFTFGA